MTSESKSAAAVKWFSKQGWNPFPFQLESWDAYLDGQNGIVNAPTGSGKTLSLIVPILLEGLHSTSQNKGKLQALWISPIRALTKEIKFATEEAIKGLGLDWRVGIRSGDTSTTERQKQKENPPEILITTPESIHVLLSSQGYISFFENLKAVVVDEWHELMGNKRGVQTCLAISRFLKIAPEIRIWAISATIANLDEAADVLLGAKVKEGYIIVKSEVEKRISVESIIPNEINTFPWAGHLGIKMLDQIIPVVMNSKTTLIFTNTRSMCEIWYQRLLDAQPDLAGIIAMHHGSISRELRDWVENALHEEKLKAVVCTSSLDLGVDFRPVETIIQIGSPKGVSRFVQRAGRSGHQPGAISKIHFVPTHTLELVEGAALRTAIAEGVQEPRLPFIRSFDVLIQYLMTLAVSEGFDPQEIFEEVKQTFCFESMTQEEWQWCLNFMVTGGNSLEAYDEFQRVVFYKGRYIAANKYVARRHKLSIGTIVGDSSITLKYMSGRKVGTIEEWFISQIKPGEAFWFAGRPLELMRIKDMTAYVRKSKKKNTRIPSWMGGRMPLSSMLAKLLRRKMYNYADGVIDEIELDVLSPLFEKQREVSSLPKDDQFLVEYFETREGFHLCMYPFEGRFVHEGIAALLAMRIADKIPISFSIAMNDYGFELLSDQKIDVDKIITAELFDTKNLFEDIQSSLNAIEMARRKFRDIAKISGLIFQGFPGQSKKEKHLQSSSSLLFDVFKEYDPDNLLYLQTFDEVLTFQLEEARLRNALQTIQNQSLTLSKPKSYTPFSFPIIVDRLNREKLSTEPIEMKIQKLLNQDK
jgi:ATP-dependent Lhr-like helicase